MQIRKGSRYGYYCVTPHVYVHLHEPRYVYRNANTLYVVGLRKSLVFWACGVTPQAAIMRSKPPLSITHAPGAMLIADVGEYTGPIYPYNDN